MNNIHNIKKEDFFKEKTNDDKIKFLLNYAILAPSTHNSQPWLFKISNNLCSIFYNDKYILPEADPKKRDLFISMGCMIENLVISAKYFNVYKNLNIKIDLQTKQIATFELLDNTSNLVDRNYESLISAIPNRINARGFYSKVPEAESIIEKVRLDLPKEYVENISIKFINKIDQIKQIAELTADGLMFAYHRSAFRKEMARWMKHSLTSEKEGIPGYSLKMPFLLSFFLPVIVKYIDIGYILGKLNKKSLITAPFVTIISSNENNPAGWIRIGMLVERMMLDINSQGLNTSIFVASVEMGEFYKKLKKIVQLNDEPQFLFIVGKVDSLSKFTPRHPIKEKII